MEQVVWGRRKCTAQPEIFEEETIDHPEKTQVLRLRLKRTSCGSFHPCIFVISISSKLNGNTITYLSCIQTNPILLHPSQIDLPCTKEYLYKEIPLKWKSLTGRCDWYTCLLQDTEESSCTNCEVIIHHFCFSLSNKSLLAYLNSKRLWCKAITTKVKKPFQISQDLSGEKTENLATGTLAAITNLNLLPFANGFIKGSSVHLNKFILINYFRDAPAPKIVQGIIFRDTGLLKFYVPPL